MLEGVEVPFQTINDCSLAVMVTGAMFESAIDSEL